MGGSGGCPWQDVSFPTLSSFLAIIRWVALCQPHPSPKAVWPSSHGPKPLKAWAEISLYFLEADGLKHLLIALGSWQIQEMFRENSLRLSTHPWREWWGSCYLHHTCIEKVRRGHRWQHQIRPAHCLQHSDWQGESCFFSLAKPSQKTSQKWLMDTVRGFITLSGAGQGTEIKLGKYCSPSGPESTQTYKVKDIHLINNFSIKNHRKERVLCLADSDGPSDEWCCSWIPVQN